VNQGSIYDSNECRVRVVVDQQPAPRDESEMIMQFLAVCERSTRESSVYGSPYSGGFNSIMECMKYEYYYFIQQILKANDNQELLKQYHWDIDVPPSPGCQVNWMWYLSAFEEVKLAQVCDYND
jgi:hypothetical protein